MEAQQHTIETNSMHGVFCADSESVNHSNSFEQIKQCNYREVKVFNFLRKCKRQTNVSYKTHKQL